MLNNLYLVTMQVKYCKSQNKYFAIGDQKSIQNRKLHAVQPDSNPIVMAALCLFQVFEQFNQKSILNFYARGVI